MTKEIKPKQEREEPKQEVKIKSPKIDEKRAVTKIVTAAGTALITQDANGTLYTLTIPEDAIILPAQVTLAPLLEIPFDNILPNKPLMGVWIGSEKFSLIGQAFLTVQPNTPKPKLEDLGDVAYGECNIGSRGFDPDICAGQKGLPFELGITPGKVVVYAKTGNDNLVLSPTVPIGEKNTFVAMIWRGGMYIASDINKEQAQKLANSTFSGSNQYYQQTEVLSHLFGLGGDLTPYQDQIKRFIRNEKSYPRETLKGAILAKGIGDDEVANARIEDFKNVIDKNFKNIRSSYFPWPRYIGIMLQVKNSLYNKSSSKKEWKFIPEISAHSRTPQEATKETMDGLANWLQSITEKENNARGTFGDKNASYSEKLQAIETIIGIGNADKEDMKGICSWLADNAGDCRTRNQCQRVRRLLTGFCSNPEAAQKARDKEEDIIAKARKACENQGKKLVIKNLSNYGQNEFECVDITPAPRISLISTSVLSEVSFHLLRRASSNPQCFSIIYWSRHYDLLYLIIIRRDDRKSPFFNEFCKLHENGLFALITLGISFNSAR